MDKREAEAKIADEMDDMPRLPDRTVQSDGSIAQRYTPDDDVMEGIFAAQDNPDTEHLSHYVCEVCDVEVDLTEAEAYSAGWDYPPFIGIWGIVSPRTCPNCLIDKTAYWAVITGQALTDKHRATITRIMGEQIVVPGD